MRSATEIAFDRAEAALLGGAIGDALGMPTQTLTRNEITEKYGAITDFVAPVEGHPVSHGLVAASITDDTEQTLLLAKRIIESPLNFDELAWAQDLLDWEAGVKARGLHDLLGPSTKQALKNVLAGMPPDKTGLRGTTNGASMRIGPVGIASPVEPLSDFLQHIATACRVTHNTTEAISSAAAVATIISAGIDGASFRDALPIAIRAAAEASHIGARAGVNDIADRLELVVSLAQKGISPEALASQTGTSVASHESIVAAFGVVVMADFDPWQAALISAAIGDDTDTIGAIATSMAAACSGMASLPSKAVREVQTVNALKLKPVVKGLLEVRISRSDGTRSSCQVPS